MKNLAWKFMRQVKNKQNATINMVQLIVDGKTFAQNWVEIVEQLFFATTVFEKIDFEYLFDTCTLDKL